MKQVTYAENSWLVGDEIADLLLEYAVVLANHDAADSVDVRALDHNGVEQTVTFLIGPATMMTVETTATSREEPDNDGALESARQRMAMIASPPPARAIDRSTLEDLHQSELGELL